MRLGACGPHLPRVTPRGQPEDGWGAAFVHARAQRAGLQEPGRGPGQRQTLLGVFFEDPGVCFVNSVKGRGGDGLGCPVPDGAHSFPAVWRMQPRHTAPAPALFIVSERAPSVPGASGLKAVPSTVALGQAVELLQQLLEVVSLHPGVHEAGPAPQIQCAQLLGQVPECPVPGRRRAEGAEHRDAVHLCGGWGYL